jgi:PhnB protein
MTGIAPWISVENATEAVAFYIAAFGAVELERLANELGDVDIARLSVGGADFWIQNDPASTPDALHGSSVRMILTVDDPDSVFAQSLAAGASEIASMYEEHGWRIGRIADPSGHHWEIGRRIG